MILKIKKDLICGIWTHVSSFLTFSANHYIILSISMSS